MKKSTFLCVFALLFAGSIFATDYDLEVAGKTVTSDNCNDILKDGGSVKYDASSKTLTLNNATINAPNDEDGIYSKIEGLKIVVSGTNTIKILSSATWARGMNLTQTGSIQAGTNNAVLNIQGKNSQSKELGEGIFIARGTTTIDGGSKGLTINIEKPANAGIGGYEYVSNALKLKSVDININAAEGSINDSPIFAIDDLSMEGCQFDLPAGAKYDASQLAVVDQKGKVWQGGLTIKSLAGGGVLKYPVSVAGIQATSENCHDILNDGGSVTYNDATGTITLTNADIYTADAGLDFMGGATFRVELKGYNNININGKNYGIYSDGDLKFYGSGSLTVTSGLSGIIADGSIDLTGGCFISISAKSYGLSCSGGALTVNASTLVVQGDEASIISVNWFEPVNCEILSNHAYDIGYLKFYDVNGKEANDTIIIGPKYQLRVAGREVTIANATDILNDGGSARYDAETRELTLENCNVEAPVNDFGILSEMDNLSIIVKGVNTISQANSTCGCILPVIDSRGKNLNIASGSPDAVLNLKGTNYGEGISLAQGTCIINGRMKGLTINIDVSYIGICAFDPSEDIALEIKNANVNITGPSSVYSYGMFDGVAPFMLTGCSVLYPEGAYYDEETKNIVDAKKHLVFNKLCIGNAADTITTFPFVTDFNDGTLQGWRVVEADNDKDCWRVVNAGNKAHSGDYCVGSSSWQMGAGPRDPDNWLISPAVVVPANATLTWWERQKADVAAYAEHHAVYVSTNNRVPDIQTAAPVFQGDEMYREYAQQSVDLTAFAGQVVYIAFRHFNTGTSGDELYIDDITVGGKASAVETVDNAQSTMRKYVRDGQVYIVRDGKTYNALGVEVR